MVPSGKMVSLGESLECYKEVREITVWMIKSEGIFAMEWGFPWAPETDVNGKGYTGVWVRKKEPDSYIWDSVKGIDGCRYLHFGQWQSMTWIWIIKWAVVGSKSLYTHIYAYPHNHIYVIYELTSSFSHFSFFTS